MSRPGAEAGSVFIETLIAAAIVMLLLGAMYRSIADSGARHGALEDRRTAMLIARSRLAAVGAETPVAPGRAAGSEGPYVWQAEVAPYRAGTAGGTALDEVTVSVWGRNARAPLATLSTLKVAGQG